MNAPSVRVLARADHTRERGSVQQRIVVPEDREGEERAVRQMRRGHEGLRLLLLLLLPLLLSRESGEERGFREASRAHEVCVTYQKEK
jgi:hypothetical protein